MAISTALKSSPMQNADLPILAHTNTLETPRLFLRIDPEPTYCQYFGTATDDELKTYLGITTDTDLQKEKHKVTCGLTTYRTSVLFFHLIEKTSNKVIGSFAFHNWYPMHRRSEIGYTMKNEALKNKGYMKEALPAIINYGFEVMQLNRMEALIDPNNIASRRLVEGIGFKEEGLLPERYAYDGELTDSLIYGLLRKNYVG